MGFSMDVSIPAATVFVQGLLSFFSPCVLPLLPLYIGYLSGGTGVRDEEGHIHYNRSKVMIHTLFFVIGISFAFFLLGLGMSAIGMFFKAWQVWFARIGGILVMIFGLYQLGLFGSSSVLGSEHRLPFQMDKFAMSPVTALIMGFTFSFAWTPCVGPALTSVLLMSASAGSRAMGFLMIGVYTLGFVLPFLAVGLFTTSLLELFKKHRSVVKYTVKIGGVLMVCMGVMMFTGKMNAVTGYLSGVSGTTVESSDERVSEEESGEAEEVSEEESEEAEEVSEEESGVAEEVSEEESGEAEEVSEERTGEAEQAEEAEDKGEAAGEKLPAIDFELKDQFGNVHKLEDYKGKTIFLNFWATWCPPCRAEMPDIQKLYENAETEGEEALIVLGAAAPEFGQEGTEEEITAFLESNGYTYPVLMDTTGELFMSYGIGSFPTTFMIDRDGNIFGYVSGMLSMDMMENIVEQTMSGVRK